MMMILIQVLLVLLYLALTTGRVVCVTSQAIPSSSWTNHVRDINQVVDFVRKHGGYFYEHLVPMYSPDAGYSLHFDKSTPVDAFKADVEDTYMTILRIPRSVMICNTTYNKVTGSDNLLENVLRAMITNRTFWEPYFRSLPLDMELLWYWSKEELDRLEDPHLSVSAIGRRNYKNELYTTLVKRFPFNLTYFEFKLADFWVTSRSFAVEFDHCVCPCADLPNHNGGSVRTHWQWSTDNKTGEKFFHMFSSDPPIPGKEFTFSYKRDMANEDALRDYGFANIDSELQWVDLELSLEERISMPGDILAMLPRLVLKYYPQTFRTMFFFRVIGANHDELVASKEAQNRNEDGADIFTWPISLQREIDALETCSSFLRKKYPTKTLLLKEMTYYNEDLPFRTKMALAFRIAYDRLYERSAHFCDRMREYVQCISFRKLQRLWKVYHLTSEPKDFVDLKTDLYSGGRSALCRGPGLNM